MIMPNSEIKYRGYVIGLCSGKDYDGEFFEGYHRKQTDSREGEEYTYNNFWLTEKDAYAGVKIIVDRIIAND